MTFRLTEAETDFFRRSVTQSSLITGADRWEIQWELVGSLRQVQVTLVNLVNLVNLVIEELLNVEMYQKCEFLCRDRQDYLNARILLEPWSGHLD